MTAAPVGRVVVVLGAGAEEVLARVEPPRRRAARVRALGGGPVGLARHAGWRALSDCEAVVVTLGDQPRLSTDAIRRVIAARGDGAEAVRATYGGEPGHPVLLERSLFARLRDVTGDHGARNLLLQRRARARCPATTSAAARTWTRRTSSTHCARAARLG